MPTDPVSHSNVNHQTRQELSNGPKDMPDRGGRGKPSTDQIKSTRIDLNRSPHPVANLESRATMGRVQTTSTECTLSRKDSDPYGDQNAIDPGYNTDIRPNTGGRKK